MYISGLGARNLGVPRMACNTRAKLSLKEARIVLAIDQRTPASCKLTVLALSIYPRAMFLA